MEPYRSNNSSISIGPLPLHKPDSTHQHPPPSATASATHICRH